MRLTRRDAIAALAAVGVGAGGTALLSDDGGDVEAVGERELVTLAAVAEVLYPTEVEGVAGFVERFVRGRIAGGADRAAGMAEAVEYLDEYAEAWFDGRFASLEPPLREDVLRRMGADAAAPDPRGSDVERVRYFVVNELLFALYASPTGGELVGVENPPGHPGGLASYQRGPEP